MTHHWFARIRQSHDVYGRWVPTGQTEFVAACDYIHQVYGLPVREWLQMPVT